MSCVQSIGKFDQFPRESPLDHKRAHKRPFCVVCRRWQDQYLKKCVPSRADSSCKSIPCTNRSCQTSLGTTDYAVKFPWGDYNQPFSSSFVVLLFCFPCFSRFASWLHAICWFNLTMARCSVIYTIAKRQHQKTNYKNPTNQPNTCFHNAPPTCSLLPWFPSWKSTHDVQCYACYCLCSNNSCHKCPLRNNSTSQSGLLLLKAFFHESLSSE